MCYFRGHKLKETYNLPLGVAQIVGYKSLAWWPGQRVDWPTRRRISAHLRSPWQHTRWPKNGKITSKLSDHNGIYAFSKLSAAVGYSDWNNVIVQVALTGKVREYAGNRYSFDPHSGYIAQRAQITRIICRRQDQVEPVRKVYPDIPVTTLKEFRAELKAAA